MSSCFSDSKSGLRRPQLAQPALVGVKRSQMRGSSVNSSKVNGPGSRRMGWLAGLGWLGWAGLTKGPAAACRNLPCPSAAARELWVGSLSLRGTGHRSLARVAPRHGGRNVPRGTCIPARTSAACPPTNSYTPMRPAPRVGATLRGRARCRLRAGEALPPHEGVEDCALLVSSG